VRKDLDDRLCAAFPDLYKDRYGDMKSTCMCWGFCCGDGWFDIIYGLSKALTAEIQKLPEDERESYRACQVKEKFGTLSFYMTALTEEMDRLVIAAENKSGCTCEVCGKPGVLRSTHGWYYTSCENHNRGSKE
jgi:hypothetical protein